MVDDQVFICVIIAGPTGGFPLYWCSSVMGIRIFNKENVALIGINLIVCGSPIFLTLTQVKAFY